MDDTGPNLTPPLSASEVYIILDTIVDKIYMGSTWEVHGKIASEQVYYGT